MFLISVSNFSPEQSAQNLRAGILCTEMCADFVRRICAPKCAGEFCADLCGGVLRAELCRGCSSTLCAECAAGNFSSRDARGSFFSVDDVRGDVFGDGRGNSGPKRGAGGAGGAKKGQKGPKMPKMAQNGPKWPKRGGVPENGPKWHILSPSGTRVVRGPLRLIAQGGKSRQNMH